MSKRIKINVRDYVPGEEISDDVLDAAEQWLRPKCDASKPMSICNNPNCSWFKHSQVGLSAGSYPPGYDGSFDSVR